MEHKESVTLSITFFSLFLLFAFRPQCPVAREPFHNVKSANYFFPKPESCFCFCFALLFAPFIIFFSSACLLRASFFFRLLSPFSPSLAFFYFLCCFQQFDKPPSASPALLKWSRLTRGSVVLVLLLHLTGGYVVLPRGKMGEKSAPPYPLLRIPTSTVPNTCS